MEVKYPNSANLFQFCKSVLDIKFGSVRVIDQDVGQILGFDPADCSHWKKGKKNIKSYKAAKSIAEHLAVDEVLVYDILSGDLNAFEAMHEFFGYGDFSFSPKSVESFRKLYYRSSLDSWKQSSEESFDDILENQFKLIDEAVSKIHRKINFEEAPLYLPEILAAYANLSLSSYKATQAEIEDCRIKLTEKDGKYTISYPTEIRMKPYLRFKIAKTMAHFFFNEFNIKLPIDLGDSNDQLMHVYTNYFAAQLIAPKHILLRELSKVEVTKDIVTQVADGVWASRLFVNSWLKTNLNISKL